MTVTLLSVGKLKEKYLREALAEYAKRLQAYCSFRLVEVKDEPAPEGLSPAQKEAVLRKEGERLLEKLSDGEHVITLEIGGRECSSEELAEHIRQLMLNGCSRLAFVIGGSLGLSSQVRQRADDHLSFSRLTFPHQLMRILVPEQLYRAFKIQKGEPYHK